MTKSQKVEALKSEIVTLNEQLGAAKKAAEKKEIRLALDAKETALEELEKSIEENGGAGADEEYTEFEEIKGDDNKGGGEIALIENDDPANLVIKGVNGEGLMKMDKGFFDMMESLTEDDMISLDAAYYKMQPNREYFVVVTGMKKIANKFWKEGQPESAKEIDAACFGARIPECNNGNPENYLCSDAVFLRHVKTQLQVHNGNMFALHVQTGGYEKSDAGQFLAMKVSLIDMASMLKKK